MKVRESLLITIPILALSCGLWVLSGKIKTPVVPKKSSVYRLVEKKTGHKPTNQNVALTILSLINAYVFYRIITSSYELTPSNLIIRKGFFFRTEDVTEMSKILDYRMVSTPIHLLMGLRQIELMSPRDVSQRSLLMVAIRKKEADAVMDHLHKHTVSNMTELVKSREKK